MIQRRDLIRYSVAVTFRTYFFSRKAAPRWSGRAIRELSSARNEAEVKIQGKSFVFAKIISLTCTTTRSASRSRSRFGPVIMFRELAHRPSAPARISIEFAAAHRHKREQLVRIVLAKTSSALRCRWVCTPRARSVRSILNVKHSREHGAAGNQGIHGLNPDSRRVLSAI